MPRSSRLAHRGSLLLRARIPSASMQSAGDTSQGAPAAPFLVEYVVAVKAGSSADEDTDVVYVDADMVQEAGASEPDTAEEHEATAEETTSTAVYSSVLLPIGIPPFMQTLGNGVGVQASSSPRSLDGERRQHRDL